MIPKPDKDITHTHTHTHIHTQEKKITKEGTLPNLFYEATITLIPKPDKVNTKKKTLLPNSDLN